MVFWTVVAVLLVCLLVYLLNVSIPPNTANPVKYRLVAIFAKIFDDVARIKAWLTGADYRIVLQEKMKGLCFKLRKGHPDVKVTEEDFDGVHVYIYQRHGSKKNRPGLMYYHGGGFLFGHPVAYESIIGRFVKQFDLVVVAPVYRLTPKVKAPVCHEDCRRATDYFFQNAEKYGVNPELIGSSGDSAGGNLAASMCLMRRDQEKNQFAFQVLIYPWTQGIDNHTPSRQRNGRTAYRFLSGKAIPLYLGSLLGVDPSQFDDVDTNRHVAPQTWEKYKHYFDINDIPLDSIPSTYYPIKPREVNNSLVEQVKDDLMNPYIFPLMADDLSNLPPAFVMTIENDPLRDDGLWYAKRLRKSGVTVTHYHSSDGFHGMMSFIEPPIMFDSALKAMDNVLSFIGEYVDVDK